MTDTATRTAPATAPAEVERLVGAFDRCDVLVRLVEERLAQLVELAPGLRVRRSFFDGAWVVGVHAGGAADPVRPFSRLDFELRIDEKLHLRCRTTLRQRDWPTESFDAATDADGFACVERFVEESIARFAEGYFART